MTEVINPFVFELGQIQIKQWVALITGFVLIVFAQNKLKPDVSSDGKVPNTSVYQLYIAILQAGFQLIAYNLWKVIIQPMFGLSESIIVEYTALFIYSLACLVITPMLMNRYLQDTIINFNIDPSEKNECKTFMWIIFGLFAAYVSVNNYRSNSQDFKTWHIGIIISISLLCVALGVYWLYSQPKVIRKDVIIPEVVQAEEVPATKLELAQADVNKAALDYGQALSNQLSATSTNEGITESNIAVDFALLEMDRANAVVVVIQAEINTEQNNLGIQGGAGSRTQTKRANKELILARADLDVILAEIVVKQAEIVVNEAEALFNTFPAEDTSQGKKNAGSKQTNARKTLKEANRVLTDANSEQVAAQTVVNELQVVVEAFSNSLWVK